MEIFSKEFKNSVKDKKDGFICGVKKVGEKVGDLAEDVICDIPEPAIKGLCIAGSVFSGLCVAKWALGGKKKEPVDVEYEEVINNDHKEDDGDVMIITTNSELVEKFYKFLDETEKKTEIE